MTRFTNTAGLRRALSRATRHLLPPPDLRPSDWAEQNIKIPAGNAIPGMMRFDNAPYQREPLDMTVMPGCNRITLMWGAQVGKTQLGLCAQAYRIAQLPSSQMMCQPSQGDLQTWMQTKFNPLVESNEGLADLIAKPRARDGVNNDRMKSYPGGFIMFAWSGSPKTMRGRSAPFILCDETDGYDRTHEGHPVSLLFQRAATFGDARLLLEISTPTLKGASWIESAYDEGDQRRFHVACPECSERQVLKWSNVTWGKHDDGTHDPATARYACEHCGSAWNDGQRIAAIRGGVWVASKPFRGHASYHLSELYSCFRKLGDIVQSFLDKKAAGDLQTFVNVSLAETWEEEGEQQDAATLAGRVEPFTAQVPAGGVYLTAGVDMQMDRLEVETVAWGLGMESWSVDYHVIWGDPLTSDPWDALDDYLDQTFTHANGDQMGISAACLDTGGTGGYTQAAYSYVQGKRGHKLFAVKGVGGWGRPVVTAPSKKKAPRAGKAVNLFTVGTDEAKNIVSRYLSIGDPGPGYCHFPAGRDDEYFEQLAAEKLVTRHVKGHPVREWHKMRPRNEALDCRVYALAAVKIMNPNIARLADRMAPSDEPEPQRPVRAEQPAVEPQQETPPEDAQPEKRQTRRRKSRSARRRGGSSWATNW